MIKLYLNFWYLLYTRIKYALSSKSIRHETYCRVCLQPIIQSVENRSLHPIVCREASCRLSLSNTSSLHETCGRSAKSSLSTDTEQIADNAILPFNRQRAQS